MLKRILIVDDDKDMVQMLTRRLTFAGYEVRASYDALYAVRMVFEEKPDLVILDITMPAGGGLSVFERLRLMNTTSPVPVIFLTADTDEELKKQLLAKGAKDFVSKPFKGEEILEKIQNVLNESVQHKC